MQQFRVKNLNWEPKGAEKPVLSSIALSLEPGHFYGILGANGSGKTSLLRHMLRLLPSDKAIFLEELALESWNRKELAKKLAYVPQNTACEADFTAEEIVGMGRFPHQNRFEAASADDKRAVDEAIRMANCEALRRKSVLHLSGGELQRVVAARAIAQEAEWMLLDEPVSQLDIKHQVELMELMKNLCETGNTTVVAVLHDVNLALRYCDRVFLMKEGRLLYSGETQLVINRENLADIYGLPFEELWSESGAKYMVPAAHSAHTI